MGERRHLREILGNVRVVAWVCPIEGHDNQPGEPLRVTVDWDDNGVAHCTTPGCPFTSNGPKRIQRKRAKGWTRPDNTVIVDRSSRWGNPFTEADFPTVAITDGIPWDQQWREWAVGQYGDWLNGDVGTDTIIVPGKRPRYYVRPWILANLGDLRGKDLACFCPVTLPCHADVLLARANGGDA